MIKIDKLDKKKFEISIERSDAFNLVRELLKQLQAGRGPRLLFNANWENRNYKVFFSVMNIPVK